jgi:hypothetical protein
MKQPRSGPETSWRAPVEPGRVDRVLRQVDDLVRKGRPGSRLRCGASPPGSPRPHAASRPRPASACRPAHIGQPFALAPPLRVEARRPGHAAVQRPQHEGHPRAAHFAAMGETAVGVSGVTRCTRSKRPAAMIRPEAAPDQALEIGIDQAVDRGVQRPGLALAPMRSTWARRHIGRASASVSMAVTSRPSTIARPAGWPRGCGSG